jgi:hypothetical protein
LGRKEYRKNKVKIAKKSHLEIIRYLGFFIDAMEFLFRYLGNAAGYSKWV